MLTAAQAASDPDVAWLRAERAEITAIAQSSIHLSSYADEVAALVAQGQPAGASLVSDMRTVYAILYPYSSYLYAQEMPFAQAETNLTNVLTGAAPYSSLAGNAVALRGSTAFINLLASVQPLIQRIMQNLSSYPINDNLIAFADLTTLKSSLENAANSTTVPRINAIAARFVAPTLGPPLPVVGPLPGGIIYTLPPIQQPKPGSGGGITFGGGSGSGSKPADNTSLYIAITAALASVGGWFYLRNKHGVRR